MRDIRFRAWDIKNKRMLPVTRIDWCKSGIPCSWICWDEENYDTPMFFPDNSILEQSTGLLDKNGKDLDWWEGDILEWLGVGFPYPDKRIVVIKWSGGGFWIEYRQMWKKIGTIHEEQGNG